MQREACDDISNHSQMESSSQTTKLEGETFSNKKRKRNNCGWSRKEEERILRYALKLSEKECQRETTHEVFEKNLSSIPPTSTFYASEEDFISPLSYFEKLWKDDVSSPGIIKIIPAESWTKKQKENFSSEIRGRLVKPDKKLPTRRQVLNQLYLAKVINYYSYFNIFSQFCSTFDKNLLFLR
jgi:hypothetical protein